MRRTIGAGCLALALAGLPTGAWADEHAAATRCRATLARQGRQLFAAAGRAADACVQATLRSARAGRGSAADVDDCLGPGLAAKLAAATRRLERADDAWCRAAADQPPAYGYAGAATLGAVARELPRDLLVALFGEHLAALTTSPPATRSATRCQAALAAAARRLSAAVWKDVADAAAAPATDARELHTRALAAIAAGDGARARFRSTVRRACATTAPSLVAPPCGTAADTTALARCAEDDVARRTYAAVGAAFALDVPCDLTDDGVRNASCLTPALEEHLLNRVGYGPDPWTLDRLRTLGIRGYVAEQLHPETISDEAVDAMLAELPSLTMSFLDLRTHYPNRPAPGQAQSGDVLKELQNAKVLRAAASHRQLEQVLVDFWFNHFNIVATDRRDYDISPYERLAIRPHVLGRFRDLLLAVARSPGMGDYLDARRNRVGALNENFARELMELHTIGVDAGFTEDDVHDVARAFTGWKENQYAPDGFEYVAQFHDAGPKRVLGTTLAPNGGYDDGIAVLDLLASHPATARRIARKLVVRFVGDAPPPALVDAAAATYRATDGDLRAVLETILLSPDFLDDAENRRAKVKRPLHLLASIVRATGADPRQLNLDRIRRRVRELGEDLYGFPAPSGYPDVSSYWTSPGTVLLRFNLADLTARGVDGIVPIYPATERPAPAIVDALAARYCRAGVSDETRAAAIAFVDAVGEADLSARPAAAASVLLSSPEFLVH